MLITFRTPVDKELDPNTDPVDPDPADKKPDPEHTGLSTDIADQDPNSDLQLLRLLIRVLILILMKQIKIQILVTPILIKSQFTQGVQDQDAVSRLMSFDIY